MTDLRKRGIVTKVRKLKTGKKGRRHFVHAWATCSPAAQPIYAGEVAFKGEILAGERLAIVDRNLFDAVQAKLDEQLNNHNAARMKSEALLAGRIFDDRGNRMSPSHARKRGMNYRYYLSTALIQGRAERAGSMGQSQRRAFDIEALVIKSVREHLKPTVSIDDRSLVNTHVLRVEIQADKLIIRFSQAQKSNRKRAGAEGTLLVPWQKTPSTRRREIFLPGNRSAQNARPIRPETRATLSHRLLEGGGGLTNLSLNHRRIPRRSQRGKAAASARSI